MRWLLAVALTTTGCDGCGETSKATSGVASSASEVASSAAAAPTASAKAIPISLPECLPPQQLEADPTKTAPAIEQAKKQLEGGDRLAAIGHYERACRMGLLEACHAAARLLSRRSKGFERDVPRALGLLNFACNHGDALGCENLAARYLSGGGVPRDHKRAAFKLKCACELDSADACSTLATIFRGGVGPDLAKGRALDLTACEGEVSEACARLAVDYENGTMVEKDASKATELWAHAYTLRLDACETGKFGFECAELSQMIRNGKGTEKNPAAAHRFAEMACAKLDHGQGCLDSARDLATGVGVAKDMASAKTRYAKACKSGDVDADGHKEACDASE